MQKTLTTMANYIRQSLEEGETIIFKGRLHWSYIFRYLFFSLLLLLLGAFCIYLAYYRHPEHQTTLFYLGIGSLVLSFFVWIIGRIVRTRSEFAVTDTRFVQKDGIFNIKMTEIPLARIETVNFYQSLWQRLLGTGCVEMVGSGGTSHQVHCIENPMKVRKIICASIKKPQPQPVPEVKKEQTEVEQS